MSRYAGHGLTLGVSTALFAWLGSLLDEQLGTHPFLVLVGAMLGFAGGFYSMYRQLVTGSAGPDEEIEEAEGDDHGRR